MDWYVRIVSILVDLWDVAQGCTAEFREYGSFFVTDDLIPYLAAVGSLARRNRVFALEAE